MTGAAQFGILIGTLAYALPQILPEGLGSAVLWTLVAFQLGVAATLTWRRTGLRLSAAAMALGALYSVTVVSLIVTAPSLHQLLWREHWAVSFSAVLLPPVLLLIDRCLRPEQWRRWGEHAKSCSLLDYLAMRHIPDWRS